MPRLGVERLEDRCAAYALAPPWSTPSITYSFVPGLDFDRPAVERALSQWASVAPLTFREVPDTGPALPFAVPYPATPGVADVRFHFGADIFGAPSGQTVGVGFFPDPTGQSGLAGDVFFRDDQGSSTFEGVALHEVGHALGLRHSDVPFSVMDALLQNPPFTRLQPDDVAGIRALYGAGVGSVTPLRLVGAPPPAQPDGTPPTQLGSVAAGAVPPVPYADFAGRVEYRAEDLDRDGVLDAVFAAQGAQGHLKYFDGAAGKETVSSLAFPGYAGDVGLTVYHGVVEMTAVPRPSALHVKYYDAVGAETSSFLRAT